jgi:hypothetical protein
MKLTNLARSLRMSVAVPVLPLQFFVAWEGTFLFIITGPRFESGTYRIVRRVTVWAKFLGPINCYFSTQ